MPEDRGSPTPSAPIAEIAPSATELTSTAANPQVPPKEIPSPEFTPLFTINTAESLPAGLIPEGFSIAPTSNFNSASSETTFPQSITSVGPAGDKENLLFNANLTTIAIETIADFLKLPKESIQCCIHPDAIVGSDSTFYRVDLLTMRELTTTNPFEAEPPPSKLIFRIPDLGLESGRFENRLWLESDIYALDFIRTYTDLPIPFIYGYNLGTHSPIGKPYILMDFMEGLKVDDVWEHLSEAKKMHCLNQCAESMRKLGVFGFKHIGVLGRDNRKGYHVKGIPTMANRTSVIRGPYERTKVYLDEMLHDKVVGLEDEKMETPKIKQHLTLLKLLTPALTDPELPDTNFFLSLPEFDARNILVDEDGNIKGFIGWKKVMTMPRAMGCSRYPSWITKDWIPTQLNPSDGKSIKTPTRNSEPKNDAAEKLPTVSSGGKAFPRGKANDHLQNKNLSTSSTHIEGRKEKHRGGKGRSKRRGKHHDSPRGLQDAREDESKAQAVSVWAALPENIIQTEAAEREERRRAYYLEKGDERSSSNVATPTQPELGLQETYKKIVVEESGERKPYGAAKPESTSIEDIAKYRRFYDTIIREISPQDESVIKSSLVSSAVHVAITNNTLRPVLVAKLAKYVFGDNINSGLLGMVGGGEWAKGFLKSKNTAYQYVKGGTEPTKYYPIDRRYNKNPVYKMLNDTFKFLALSTGCVAGLGFMAHKFLKLTRPEGLPNIIYFVGFSTLIFASFYAFSTYKKWAGNSAELYR